MKPLRFNLYALVSTLKGRKILSSLLNSLRPSLLEASDDVQASSAYKSPTKSNIEALDGLRGIACLIVFNEHFTYNFTYLFIYGYGNFGRHTFLQMPFVKIFWSGTPMVSVFYMISGYVLSHKPLKQIRAKQTHSFQNTVTSSIIRRGFRLYSPALIAILMCGSLIRLGAFNYSWYLWNKDNNYLHLHERPPPLAKDFISQVYDLIPAAFGLLNPWDWRNNIGAGDYDLHTWTIAVEFRASMILYLGLIATSTFKQFYRLLTVIAAIGFCICTDRCDVLLFFAGMFAAEIDMIIKARSENQDHLPSNPVTLDSKREHDIELLIPPASFSTRQSLKASCAWLLAFIAGIYLLCTPLQGGDSTYGYMTLLKIMPPSIPDRGNLPRAMGAILTVWASVNCAFLQILFTNRFSLYFGKISFALYLVHGNILKSLGYAVMSGVYKLTSPTGKTEDIDRMGFFLSWILCAIVVWPITLWASDLFNSVIDVRCVKFARWIEEKAKAEDL